MSRIVCLQHVAPEPCAECAAMRESARRAARLRFGPKPDALQGAIDRTIGRIKASFDDCPNIKATLKEPSA